MSMNTTLVTDDGAHTMLSGEFGVTYHSLHGALLETNTVFIDMGLKYKLDQKYSRVKIFEMGFGTGLNALCTIDSVSKLLNIHVDYTTIEAYPISLDEVNRLNYIELLGEQYRHPFLAMHSSASNVILDFPNFTFTKLLGSIEQLNTQSRYDVIYYDAFSPTTQPILWEAPMMKRMYDLLEPGGILCTYCAKGIFKRVLKEVGFVVESLPGPGRKREITRAVKSIL